MCRSAALGGKGGGKPEMAQAGLKDASKLKDALQEGHKAIQAVLNNLN